MINPRAIFPTAMFAVAAFSFGFGIWQYVYAQHVQASATQRMAYIMTTIDGSAVAPASKQTLYASIMTGLPKAPSTLGIDFSGSFASQGPLDACISDGQRAVCQALKTEQVPLSTRTSICGVCDPQ